MLAAFHDRHDFTLARERRNAAIREAHTLVRLPAAESGRRGARSTPVILAQALHAFQARAWPQLRHLAEPPANTEPLRRAFFDACRAIDDMGIDMPDERQIRRIINP